MNYIEGREREREEREGWRDGGREGGERWRERERMRETERDGWRIIKTEKRLEREQKVVANTVTIRNS